MWRVAVTDLLNLSSVVVLSHADEGDLYRIRAAGKVVPTAWPNCKSGLFRHGNQMQRFMDTPMHGKRALVEIERQRYRCRACGKTVFEPLPDMDDKRQMTSRLLAYIEKNSLRKTFSDLAREVGVDDKTIRHVFDDYRERLGATTHFETPRILGIDELMIIGEYRAMITNIENLSLYDMLPTRKKVDLLEYFKQLPDKQRVEIVTMDMWNVYRQVVRAQLPNRIVVGGSRPKAQRGMVRVAWVEFHMKLSGAPGGSTRGFNIPGSSAPNRHWQGSHALFRIPYFLAAAGGVRLIR